MDASRIDPPPSLTADVQALVEALESISGSLDTDRTADRILDGLKSVVPFDSATIFVLERQSGGGNELALKRTSGRRKEAGRVQLAPLAPVPADSVVGRVLREGRAIHLERVDLDAEKAVEELGASTGTVMVAPILGGRGRVLGALQAEADGAGSWDASRFELFRGYAVAVGAALERSLLYSRLLSERRLTGELEVAGQVMAGLLPNEAPSLEGFDIGVYYEPCHEIGGDYYDFIALENDRLGIAMADVSGKGVAAALMVAAMRASLYTLAKRELALRAILQRANEFLHDSAGTDTAKYVTLFYAVLDVQARRFIYINAGHLPPVVMRSDGKVELLHSGGFPIGLFDNPRYFEQFLQLESGDLLALYTDGVTEAEREEDELYGRERLVELLGKVRGLSAQEIANAVAKDTRHFSRGSQRDDATCLVIKAV